MQDFSIEEITAKLHDLSPDARLEVIHFVEFLISKKKTKKRTEKIRENLLKVSIWSEADIKEIENVSKEFNKWAIEKF